MEPGDQEVRLRPSHRNWETGFYFPWVFACQRDGSQDLQKHVPGSEKQQRAYIAFKRINIYFKEMKKERQVF